MVCCNACAFMWATISTSPDCASVTTQVTSPSASNLGAKARPSSTSSVETRWTKGGTWSDKTTLKMFARRARGQSADRLNDVVSCRSRARGNQITHLRGRAWLDPKDHSTIAAAHHGDK